METQRIARWAIPFLAAILIPFHSARARAEAPAVGGDAKSAVGEIAVKLTLPESSFFENRSKPGDSRPVFAWYLSCCSAFSKLPPATAGAGPNPSWPQSPVPPRNSVDGYKAEMLMATRAGYDGFAIDEMAPAGPLSTSSKQNISAMFQAAEEIGGFKLYFVFDQTSANASDYVALVKAYASHPNYFTVAGRPVVSAYNADNVQGSVDTSVNWWRRQVFEPLERDDHIRVFWVPVAIQASSSTYRCAAPTSAWRDPEHLLLRGYSAWEIQRAPIGGGLSCLEKFASSAKQAGIGWIATLSWQYWNGSSFVYPHDVSEPNQIVEQKQGHYYEHAGGLGLDLSWNSILNAQLPLWVTMLTWNDYQESYGAPIDDFAKYRDAPGNGIGRYVPLGWYKDQSGMAELNRYYIEWFKEGMQPRIRKNAIFFEYRTTPEEAAIPTTNQFVGTVDNGRGEIGNLLTVSSVRQGSVIPGEIICLDGACPAKIISQVSGRPLAEGQYMLDHQLKLGAEQLSQTNPVVHPLVTTGGEPNDPIYVTIAAAEDGLEFNAEYGLHMLYPRAVVDGHQTALPCKLTPGLHQIRIAPFVPGPQNFSLMKKGMVKLSIKGPDINSKSPLYDFFPATGYVEQDRDQPQHK